MVPIGWICCLFLQYHHEVETFLLFIWTSTRWIHTKFAQTFMVPKGYILMTWCFPNIMSHFGYVVWIQKIGSQSSILRHLPLSLPVLSFCLCVCLPLYLFKAHWFCGSTSVLLPLTSREMKITHTYTPQSVCIRAL